MNNKNTNRCAGLDDDENVYLDLCMSVSVVANQRVRNMCVHHVYECLKMLYTILISKTSRSVTIWCNSQS